MKIRYKQWRGTFVSTFTPGGFRRVVVWGWPIKITYFTVPRGVYREDSIR